MTLDGTLVTISMLAFSVGIVEVIAEAAEDLMELETRLWGRVIGWLTVIVVFLSTSKILY
jgi:hypothetical protein